MDSVWASGAFFLLSRSATATVIEQSGLSICCDEDGWTPDKNVSEERINFGSQVKREESIWQGDLGGRIVRQLVTLHLQAEGRGDEHWSSVRPL